MISVILSTNNELRNNYLEALFDALNNQNSECEIIVVDNSSSDATRDVCKKYTQQIHVLENSNRAERFNYGLKKAKWDIIVFHHAATIIPRNSLRDLETALSGRYVWWWYRHSFDVSHPLLKFTSWYSNHVRAKHSGILYADHIIFWKTEVFRAVGWFPNMDVFEETPLCKNLVKRYGKPILLDHSIITSARRFTRRGVYKHALFNQYLKLCYYLWVSHKTMNKSYESRDGYNVKY